MLIEESPLYPRVSLTRAPAINSVPSLCNRPARPGSGCFPAIHQRTDGDILFRQVENRLVGRVVVGGDHDMLTGADGVAVQIMPHGAGQHDPGPVVIGENQALFNRACGQQDMARPDGPVTLPPGGALATLQQGGDVVVINAADRRCGQ